MNQDTSAVACRKETILGRESRVEIPMTDVGNFLAV